MEDILASIRRIIADDEAAPHPIRASDSPATVQRPPAQPQSMRGERLVAAPQPDVEHESRHELEGRKAAHSVEQTQSEVLDLTEPMAAAAVQKADSFRTIDRSDVALANPSDAETEFYHSRPEPQRPLLSTAATTAVNSAFNALAQTVLVQNARTLEDLVKEMLRPLLKTWLDDNLPGLVERLVRAEIERVSRGRP